MSAHIADYVLMQETDAFSLPVWETTEHLAQVIDNEHTLAFRLPPNAVLNEPSIIAFVADPSALTESTKYEIEINSHVFAMGNFGTGVKRGLWKIVSAGVLRAGESNNIIFRTLDVQIPDHGGQPTIKFSDIVLWFQRDVASV
jgi:hypothetical protein